MGVKTFIATLALCVFATIAAAQTPNLIKNGNFEDGVTDKSEPIGWHSRIVSYTTIPEYADPANKKGRTGKYNFKCGCGHDWGNVRPWAQLYCPKCHQMVTGLEEAASWYDENFKYVSLGDGKTGKGVTFTMPSAVAENQGTRVISTLVKAERGAGYEISFDAMSKGPTMKVFVEAFKLEEDKKSTEWVKTLPEESNPLKQTTRLRRIFRKQVDVQNPSGWKHFSEQFASPNDRYDFDVMCVSLYAYYPAGECAYDNIVLRKLTPAELAKYRKDNPRASEERFTDDGGLGEDNRKSREKNEKTDKPPAKSGQNEKQQRGEAR